MLDLTIERWRELTEINREVNRSTKYKSDYSLYGRQDFWTIADGEGDCEDYALAKRQRLLKAGWPEESLKLAACNDENGDGHAVLTVDTNRGTYVLDNRIKGVLPWKVFPYKWRWRQGVGKVWEKIV